MKLTDLATAQKISIAGYGVEGRAAEKFCKAHFPKADLYIVECISAVIPNDGSIWIVSPGIPRMYFSHIPSERVTSGTEIFFDSLSEDQRRRVIGISGTKGKSTTTKFCTEALLVAGKKVVAAGNYGVPLLEVLDDFLQEKYDYIVTELSSYQLENLRTSPGISIFPDHLDRHGSVSAYEDAKAHLWKHQKEGDLLIAPKVLEKRIDTAATLYKAPEMEDAFFPQDSAFRARHWLQNFGTVQQLFDLLFLSSKAIREVAQNFEGLPHRLQRFSGAHNRTWWDDAICTNPEAAVATVKFFAASLGAILLGGQDRGMDYVGFAKTLTEVAPQALVLVLESELSDRLRLLFPQAVEASSFNEAVQVILKRTPEKTNIVLCPAAPSYDRFKNFQEKGDAFQYAVADAGV